MWEDEEVDAGSPSPGAEDGDPLWVSAEVADVLVEPAQGLNLVQQPIVPLSRLITGTEEAWVFVETMIDVGRRWGRIFKRGQGRDKDRWEKNKGKEDIEEGGMQRREENKERRERLD